MTWNRTRDGAPIVDTSVSSLLSEIDTIMSTPDKVGGTPMTPLLNRAAPLPFSSTPLQQPLHRGAGSSMNSQQQQQPRTMPMTPTTTATTTKDAGEQLQVPRVECAQVQAALQARQLFHHKAWSRLRWHASSQILAHDPHCPVGHFLEGFAAASMADRSGAAVSLGKCLVLLSQMEGTGTHTVVWAHVVDGDECGSRDFTVLDVLNIVQALEEEGRAAPLEEAAASDVALQSSTTTPPPQVAAGTGGSRQRHQRAVPTSAARTPLARANSPAPAARTLTTPPPPVPSAIVATTTTTTTTSPTPTPSRDVAAIADTNSVLKAKQERFRQLRSGTAAAESLMAKDDDAAAAQSPASIERTAAASSDTGSGSGGLMTTSISIPMPILLVLCVLAYLGASSLTSDNCKKEAAAAAAAAASGAAPPVATTVTPSYQQQPQSEQTIPSEPQPNVGETKPKPKPKKKRFGFW